MKLTLERHLVMRIKDKSNCREMKLTLEIHLVMRIKDKSNCRDKLVWSCVLKLEKVTLSGQKDKSNCRDD